MSTPPPPHPGYRHPGYQHQPIPGPYPPVPGPYQQPYAPYQLPYQYQYGAPPPAACQLCGAVPAAPVTVRGHQGMVVVMRFLRRQGMFCRPCALAVFRQMQADTLVQGWWGPLSVVITPFTLLANLGALAAIRRIPAPVAAGHRPPLDPGKPVFRRPQGIIALIPLGLVALVVLAVPVLLVIGLVAGPGDGSPALTVGSCARNDADWPEQDLSPEPCGSAAAQYRVLDPDDDSCPAGAYIAYPEYSATGERSLCLKPLRD